MDRFHSLTVYFGSGEVLHLYQVEFATHTARFTTYFTKKHQLNKLSRRQGSVPNCSGGAGINPVVLEYELAISFGFRHKFEQKTY